MKYSLLAATLLILFTSLSQEEDSVNVPGKWQLGYSISSDYCYRKLIDSDGTNQANIDARNEWEIPKFGYTTGINALYNFTDRLALGFGFQYSNKGFKTEMDNVIFVTTNGEEDTVDLKRHYNFQYFDIPINMNFSLGSKKIRFVGSAGLVANFFMKETTRSVIYYEDHQEYYVNAYDADYKKVNISVMASAGISYKMNEFTTLRLEPIFRYGLTKIIDASVSATLYNVGLNFSYYASF